MGRIAIAVFALLPLALTAGFRGGAGKAVSFKSQVKPIFAKNCTSCHNKDKAKGGLDLSSQAAIQKGGDSGKLYVAKKSASSLIIKRLKASKDERMPPDGEALSSAQISTIKRWIDEGAKF